jgi:hypothetical protein
MRKNRSGGGAVEPLNFTRNPGHRRDWCHFWVLQVLRNCQVSAAGMIREVFLGEATFKLAERRESRTNWRLPRS